MNVGKNSSRSNGYSSKKFVQLLVILYCKGNVSGYNTALLVVTSSISCKFENFSTKIFENSSKVDWCSSSDTSSILSLTEVSTDTTDRELKSCLCRRSGGFLLTAASFSFSCRCEFDEVPLDTYGVSNHIVIKDLLKSIYLPDMIMCLGGVLATCLLCVL